jgi:uncharacterized membrane protein YqaE (UPF0057 family)
MEKRLGYMEYHLRDEYVHYCDGIGNEVSGSIGFVMLSTTLVIAPACFILQSGFSITKLIISVILTFISYFVTAILLGRYVEYREKNPPSFEEWLVKRKNEEKESLQKKYREGEIMTNQLVEKLADVDKWGKILK